MNNENANTNGPDRGYGELADFQKRVVEERNELHEKTVKLLSFLNSETVNGLTSKQFYLLKKQLWAMEQYEKILSERIDSFFDGDSDFSEGAKLIGHFGTDKQDVFAIKTAAVVLIDEIKNRGKDSDRIATACTDAEKAQMMGVKSLFS